MGRRTGNRDDIRERRHIRHHTRTPGNQGRCMEAKSVRAANSDGEAENEQPTPAEYFNTAGAHEMGEFFIRRRIKRKQN
jgi:hypothetical protein